MEAQDTNHYTIGAQLIAQLKMIRIAFEHYGSAIHSSNEALKGEWVRKVITFLSVFLIKLRDYHQ